MEKSKGKYVQLCIMDFKNWVKEGVVYPHICFEMIPCCFPFLLLFTVSLTKSPLFLKRQELS